MNYFEVYQSCSLFGALRYFANIKDTVSLINGPTGCAFYARNAVINLNGYFESLYKVDIPKIFNLNFTESDVIFGNTNKIKEVINDIINKYSPKAIFVFNCCVSEIIGSDIDEITDLFDNILVIPIHTAGFKGDHRFGMKMAAQIICERLMPKRKAKSSELSVNILGEFDYFNRSTQELTDRLRKIGVTNVRHIPGKSSLIDLEHATSATLNIITCQNASRLMADIMEKKYGIPYIGDNQSLYGIKNTFNFYKTIYNFFGIDTTPLEKERTEAISEIKQYTYLFKDKRAAVIAGTRRALGYSCLLKELGVNIVLLFSESDCNYNKDQEFRLYSENLFLNEYIDDLWVEIQKASPDVIFTTLPEVVAPEKYLPRLSDDFAGFGGAISMARYLYNHFMNSERCSTILINE